MSVSSVRGTLSSLKSCLAELRTEMDTVTDVAMDLAETRDDEMNRAIKEMEAMMLECARLDSEINNFVDIVEQVTEAGAQQPDAMFDLSAKVKQQLSERMAQLSDADLHKHPKVIAFKESIESSVSQANQESAENMEELDEDIAITQSQVNFTCPLTQVEMVNPVKNKKCNHHYDENAILDLIKNRCIQKKKCRCPVVGCANADVRQSDLIQDQVLRRKIQSYKRQSNKT